MTKVEITNSGIKRALKQYDYCHAVAEFVWNGFDARASTVSIECTADPIGHISNISIRDNGYGINLAQLHRKFLPFLESEKEIDPNRARQNSISHGKNGVGRLTFFKFATSAIWSTVCEREGKHFTHSIEINDSHLNTYHPSEEVETTDPVGTVVTFQGIHSITGENFYRGRDIYEYLVKEFCWFLELHSNRGYAIYINNQQLDYSSFIFDSDEFNHEEEGLCFNIRYIQWKDTLNNEYSRYYFLGSDHLERFKQYTTLNNKGDKYYHSVYIQSTYFNTVDNIGVPIDDGDQAVLPFLKKDERFKHMLLAIDGYLREKRRPFMRNVAESLVEDYRNKKVFPKRGNNSWDLMREQELEVFVKELFIIEPKMFQRLNDEQQKTFVRLLSLVMDANESEALFQILNEVIQLETNERHQLADVLKSTRLSSITKTIALIQDRIKAINELKQLIIPDFGANEPSHIQKFIESHYWLFGEEYHLVTAAEPDFEQAMHLLIKDIYGIDEQVAVDHPDKNKEMDIFAVRQIKMTNKIQNIVVELKNPKVNLGEKELSQIKRYSRVIKSIPQGNASNMEWRFILVGNKFDTSGYIELELENVKRFGEQFLVFSGDNSKIYVMKWSEVIAEFELQHNYLLEKLQIERNKLAAPDNTPHGIIANLPMSSASMIKASDN